jgi:hypothetical protein
VDVGRDACGRVLRQVLPSGGDASREIARSPSARHAAASPHRAALPATSSDHDCLPHRGQRDPAPAPRVPARPVTSTRAMPSPALTVTVSPGTPRPAVPEAAAGQPAPGQRGISPARVPRAGHPGCERAGHPRPLRAPGNYHAHLDRRLSHQRTAFPPPQPPEPAGQPGRTQGMYARFGGARQAGTRRQRGPSVAVRGKADGVHRPSWRPGRPSAYLHRRGDGKWFLMAPFTVWGVLHCAPLP